MRSLHISRRHLWFPREMTCEKRVQKFHTDDASLTRCASDWSCRVFASINQKSYPDLDSARHQYGISALVSQTSFCGETSGGVEKCRLFSLASCRRRFFFLRAKGEITKMRVFPLCALCNNLFHFS